MKKKDERTYTIILAIIACVLMVINISIYINQNKYIPQQKSSENTTVQKATIKTEEEKEAEEIATLKTLGERDRMERYFGKYIGYIEEEEYEKAYNLLYEEFKQNYFKTLDDYVKYIKETYPEMISVEYTNIERQGQYYVLFVDIVDLMATSGNENKISQNIVIYETDYNEFYISFSL
ncbi:MAG TPA: hypothetical protein IAB70_03995 [Candidatus Merdicola faecigallinarum]|uniref:Uncharacterized protein n=1 Tax=Candidatus Merdicola faecigallinarum TaxID=2840862 RepID=A0A9D1M1B9_9FIRM|nr:hypothetical protein [Candidatus Merdicola faecigallinarum]